jgi:predicted nucleic acid-binding protein
MIDIQRGFAPATAWFASLPAFPVVPGLVLMELIQDARSNAEVLAAQALVRPLPVIWPSVTDQQRALTDFSRLHLSHGLGLIDALVAATAIGAGLPLATFNVKHYRHVPGLIIVQPYLR